MSGAAVTIEPLRKKVTVPLPPEEAFVLFTDGISSWWPLVSHSVAGDRAVGCRLEALAGGRIFEIDGEGVEVEWGRVLVSEPPNRLVFSWYPGRGSDTAQEVEVLFRGGHGGTEVFLEHRRWESLRADALEVRANYDSGWELVLGCFVEFVAPRPDAEPEP